MNDRARWGHESVRLWVFPFDAVAGRVTGHGRPVSPEEGIVTNPDLSPDGRTIAYVLKRAGSKRADLWVTQIDSGESGQLAQNAWGPCWSRDGSHLSPPFTGVPRVVLWPKWNMAATAPERVLVQDARAKLWAGRFSPDGRWLSFTAQSTDERARSHLMVVPAAGGAREDWIPIAQEHEWAEKPRWAPDGRTIYFLSRQNTPFFNLWGNRFDTEHGKPVGEPIPADTF